MKKRMGFLLVLTIILSLTSVFSLSDAPVFRSTKIWTDEPAGQHIFFISSIDIAVTEARFNTENSLSDSRIIIEAQNSKIDSLPSLENAYQYLTFGKFGIAESDLKNTLIRFRVEKSWASNNSNHTTIKLYYFDSGWKVSGTSYFFEDKTYYYYQAEPQKLAYLAIKGEKNALTSPVLEKAKNDSTKPARIADQLTSIGQINKTVANSSVFFGFSLPTAKNSYILMGGAGGVIILLVILLTFLNIVFKGDYIENTEAIQKIIEDEMSEGIPKKEIEKEIISNGWPKRLVNKIVHNERLPHEIEVKLKAYIDSMRNKTFSDQEIKKSLLKEGWAEETIDEFIKEFTAS